MPIRRGAAASHVKGGAGQADEAKAGGGRPRASARGLAIRRQSVLYTMLLGLGSVLIYLSGLRDLPLVTEGVAFIAIGAVGLIMSWTTQDVGRGIRDAIREDGDKTRGRLDSVVEAVDRVGASVEKVGENVEKVGESVEKVGESVEKVAASVVAMSKDNRDFFRQMLEIQKSILDSQKSILERQDIILERGS